MAIIIEDMDMPETCTDCRMRDDTYTWCWADPLSRCAPNEGGRPEWCPLKEADDGQ